MGPDRRGPCEGPRRTKWRGPGKTGEEASGRGQAAEELLELLDEPEPEGDPEPEPEPELEPEPEFEFEFDEEAEAGDAVLDSDLDSDDDLAPEDPAAAEALLEDEPRLSLR